MGRKGQQISLEHRLNIELGARIREIKKITNLLSPTEEQRQRAVRLGEEVRMLRRGELPPAGLGKASDG